MEALREIGWTVETNLKGNLSNRSHIILEEIHCMPEPDCADEFACRLVGQRLEFAVNL